MKWSTNLRVWGSLRVLKCSIFDAYLYLRVWVFDVCLVHMHGLDNWQELVSLHLVFHCHCVCVFSMVFHFCWLSSCFLSMFDLFVFAFVCFLFASLPNLFNPFHTFCWTQQTLWMLPKNCLGVHSARAKLWTNSLTHWQGPKVFGDVSFSFIDWSENMVPSGNLT